jgi:hypothetical protein
MLDDLDRALEQMLRKALPSGVTDRADITFLTPAGNFPPPAVRRPAINLFLYDVQQNLGLRVNDWIVERQPDGTTTRRKPPTQISCLYLISVWPDADAADAAETEHQILGEVLKVLLATTAIAPEFLQGTLAGSSAVLGPAPTGPGQSGPDRGQIFAGRPKAALNYAVNVGVAVTGPEPVTVVTRKTIEFELMENRGN